MATDDDTVAKRCRAMRDFEFAGRRCRITGKMSEPAAAMGPTNLEALQTSVDWNRRNHRLNSDGLSGIPGLTVVPYAADERGNYQHVIVEVDGAVSPLDRDELLVVLHAESVLARRHIYPGCHRMVPYDTWPLGAPLPETEKLTCQTLALPTGTAVSEGEVAEVCRIARQALADAPAVKRAVAAAVATYNAVI